MKQTRYSGYSFEKLLEFKRVVDRDKYPEPAREIDEEIEHRLSEDRDLIATAEGWLRPSYRVQRGSRTVATLKLPTLGWGGGEITIEGKTLRVRRESFADARFTLMTDGGSEPYARPTKSLRPTFEVLHAGRSYTLRSDSWLHRCFAVVEAGTHLGSIFLEGLLGRRLVASLPEGIPLEVQLFLIWLVLTGNTRLGDH
jgi:hypothetical protein